MGRASPAQHSFAGGELSPMIEGRQDVAKYAVGCRMLREFLPLIQGPARKRGGTQYLAEVQVSETEAHAWLVEFIFSRTDAVMLEFGDQYVRFYTDRGVIEDPPGTPYEIASPYAGDDLMGEDGTFMLSVVQSADVLYISHPRYKGQTLTRTSNTSWAFADYDPDDGPFDPQNTDTSITVKVSAATGSVTFTNDSANVPIDEVRDVGGRLVRVEETDKSATKPWEANKRIAGEGENPIGENRRSDGKFYTCATDQTVASGEVEFRTGSYRPIHTEGTEADGDGEPLYSGSTLFAEIVGVDWTYLHAGYGVIRITAITAGGADATGTVLSRFPASCVSPNTSYRWSLGAWYLDHYPSCTAFHRDRLCFGGLQRLQLSVAGDYSSQAPDDHGEVLPDSAIDLTVSVGGQDEVLWMSSNSDALIIGTAGGELALREITVAQVLGPSNAKLELQSTWGSRKVQPLNIGDCMLYVQSGGEILLEAQYDASKEKFVSIDLTVWSEHITRTGITDMAYAQGPNSTLWCVREDGLVAALTYQRAEEVIAWSLHDFGGRVVSVGCIPSPVAGIDDVYFLVERTINGNDVTYIEWLTQPHLGPADPYLHCGQDCSLTYDGAVDETLTPGTGATVAGTEGVEFTAGDSVFEADDVGREIHQRVFDGTTWSTAIAVITAFTSDTVVEAAIVTPFASEDAIPAGDWRLTATALGDLQHLEGETVRVIADGAAHDDCVVEDGEIELTRAASVVHVGFGVRGIVQCMNLEAGAEDGTAQAKIKRINEVVFRFFETMGGHFGREPDGPLDPIRFRTPSQAMETAMPLFTGDKLELWNSGPEGTGRITFVHDEGTPCTLVAIYPQVATSGKAVGS